MIIIISIYVRPQERITLTTFIVTERPPRKVSFKKCVRSFLYHICFGVIGYLLEYNKSIRLLKVGKVIHKDCKLLDESLKAIPDFEPKYCF